jgi:flagellar hook protein FlgE
MSSTFSIALSALRADSDAINTTGNNLANLNTTGFKASDLQFKNLLTQYLGNESGGGFGLGVAAPISEQVFSQGAIQTSSLPLATAIQGNGFFVVRDANGQQMFTRDGGFKLDSHGVLETQTGERVQGWTASGGAVNATGTPSDVILPAGTLLAPTATKNITANINLDASANLSATAQSFSAPVQVVDSLGNTHTISLNFTKAATANTWTYDVTIPGSELNGNPSGDISLLTAPGTITFNSDGTLNSSVTSPVALTISGLADGASDMQINWNLLNQDGTPTTTQYAEASSLASLNQDGSQAAELLQVSIQNGGQILATYSNGHQTLEAQLALAAIQNPDSLKNLGNNNFVVGADTSAPAIGLPQSGGRGQIIGGALEGSNVDMGLEFTNLIVYQSSYGANAKVITTANTISQDLLNLIQ